MAKGELRLRMPVALHEALKEQAAKQSVSLNQWLVVLLTEGATRHELRVEGQSA